MAHFTWLLTTILPISKVMEDNAIFTQQRIKKICVSLGQCANCMNVELRQLSSSCRANMEQVTDR